MNINYSESHGAGCLCKCSRGSKISSLTKPYRYNTFGGSRSLRFEVGTGFDRTDGQTDGRRAASTGNSEMGKTRLRRAFSEILMEVGRRCRESLESLREPGEDLSLY